MAEDYRARLRAGEPLDPEVRLFKQFAADQIKAEGERTYSFTISTGAIDRERDRIDPAGWHVENFLKAGGPVLWAHDSRGLPIGKAPWVKAQGGALKARVEFAPADVYPFAETVRRLVDFGALKATSVGFLPLPGKAAWNEERNGVDFMEQDLLEFSLVPVPANPQALLDAKAAGIDMAPVKAWAEGVLDGFEPGLWVPKAQAEAVFKAISEPRIVIPAFDAGPYVEETRAALTKRGRVLSAENEERIRNAHDGIEAARASLAEVLSQMPMEEEPKAVLYVSPSPKSPAVLVDPALVRSVVAAAVSETVQGAINAARGRLDH